MTTPPIIRIEAKLDPIAFLKSVDVPAKVFLKRWLEISTTSEDEEYAIGLSEMLGMFDDATISASVLDTPSLHDVIKDDLWDELRDDDEFKDQMKDSLKDELTDELKNDLDFITECLEDLDEREVNQVLQRSGVMRGLLERLLKPIYDAYPSDFKAFIKTVIDEKPKKEPTT